MIIAAAVLVLVLVVLLVVVTTKLRALAHAHGRERKEHERVVQQLGAAEQRAAALGRYQTVLDAESHAAAVMAEAERAASELRAKAQGEADRLIAQARATQETAGIAAEKVGEEARSLAAELRQTAEGLVRAAEGEAKQILEHARQKAHEIAGDAYAAMQNARQLEETARAMKNVIEGYGDKYLVPTLGLLDELAEEFGFTEAGQRLKGARERMRQMIRNEVAAACDYAEENRRTTAIHFVLDAFNGKVDSVLADVRHDNLGTHEQKIRDAYHLVNRNGQAFRNARITSEYLQARLEELKWAVVAHELKLREREEQRALKERIREEEKAQREFERAAKEAEKEEEIIRKAMEKARREIEKATDEQKAKYEEQLAQLAERLHAAEEKNKRALSMAQQTKAGHVYVISNIGSFGENVYKIGLTRRLEPLERIRELGDASVPFDFDVHALIRSEDAPALERELHKRFLRMQVNKVNPRKEFFRVPVHDIRQEVETMGCQAAWTVVAECREYKETLALERAMASKSVNENAWAESQLREHLAKVEVVEEEV